MSAKIRSMADTARALRERGDLFDIHEELDPHLVMPEIQRRAYKANSKAIFFHKVKGSRFPAISNIFGSSERVQFLLKHSYQAVQTIIQLKADPKVALAKPWRLPKAGWIASKALPLPSVFDAPVMAQETKITELPQIHSWPDDGGGFITLPQVYSEDPRRPSWMSSNVGMYRVQLTGNDYQNDHEIGMHYQIHRGLGVHHEAALAKQQELPVSIFVGGPPAHTFAGVMPLPEGLSEIMFAGMLAGRHVRYRRYLEKWLVSTEADFCILGTLSKATKPEGPFGDHLGYYSLQHDFPVLKVHKVFCRQDAVWPFTVVGRPPQEDTTFGHLIHDLTGAMVPVSLPGVKELHAVDAAGVHPLLLAIGSERYVPYGDKRPLELLTQANAILGFGQASLAKYLMIAAEGDNRSLSTNNLEAYFSHILERADWQTDLHFQTQTSMDTLDYSSIDLNRGSKVIIAAAGPVRYRLWEGSAGGLGLSGPGYGAARLIRPGIVALSAPSFTNYADESTALEELASQWQTKQLPPGLRVIVLCEDADFAAREFANFLWLTFTRSNPSHDIYGVGAQTQFKHWGCRGPLIIDARPKPHHAPSLKESPSTLKTVDDMSNKGGPLYGLF